MKKHFIFAALSLLMLPLCASADEVITSPDGAYQFTFTQQKGKMLYQVTYQGEPLITQGELGVQIDNHLVESAMGVPNDNSKAWITGMNLSSVDRTEQDNTWNPIYGEYQTIRDHYRQMTLHFIKGDKEAAVDMGYNKSKNYLMDIVVRAYDEGVAIRYHFPEATNGLFMHVVSENTSFGFPQGTKAWYEQWAQGPFKEQSLTMQEWNDECERPLLLQLPNNKYAALLEAGLHDFVRGKLKLKQDNELQFSMYSPADVITPYDMPWRVIMAGNKATDLINNKQLLLNLNNPAQGDFSFVKPGKAFRSGKLEDKWIRKSIDFAADFGIDYVELDAGWYGPEMKVASSALSVSSQRDFSMPAICQYAKEKGVGIWVYVNQRALYNQLDSILPLYRQWGIKGIKFGFVQIGNQQWTTWLHNAVKRCAEYGLMVDIHDEYRPTGWSRTYPNLLTQEGIGGNEEMPDAKHNVVLPYTRFLCGPGDYTLCYFNGRVKNTKAHQLAMSVVYYSPLQFLFWYDMPDAYKGETELDFWKQCPTVWKDSRALDGKPGEYIVQARLSDKDEWFVGMMTNTEAREITLDTSLFLEKGSKYTVEIYNDDPKLNTRTKVGKQVVTIKTGKKLTLNLQPSGGAALRFVRK